MRCQGYRKTGERAEFTDMKGFSRANLMYMRSFAAAWESEKFVQRLVGQIPWGQNITLITKVKSRDEREWYARQVVEKGWSRPVLEHQIDSGLIHRQGKAVTNFDTTLTATQSELAHEMLKDPYLFDFLSVGDEAHEREIERELVKHITSSAVDATICHESDNPSIGLILCKDRKGLIAEYALKDISKPVGVSEYQLVASIPENLKGSLPTIEELEAELADKLP